MKTKHVFIAVFAVLLAGGGLAVLTYNPTVATDEVVPVKTKVAKAVKVATLVEPELSGLMTGSIGALVFTDEVAEKQTEQ